MPTRTSSVVLAPPPWWTLPLYTSTEPRDISAGTVSAGSNAPSRVTLPRLLRGTTLVAPFASVKSVIPDGVELDVVPLGEREEVEGPLVAVDRLGRFPGADRDGLGEV